MYMLVFWVVTPCVLISTHQRFGDTYRFHLQGGSHFISTMLKTVHYVSGQYEPCIGFVLHFST